MNSCYDNFYIMV